MAMFRLNFSDGTYALFDGLSLATSATMRASIARNARIVRKTKQPLRRH